MRDEFKTEDNEPEGPEELVVRAFSRCSNYPKGRAGVLGLAQGLRLAADRFGVPMTTIVTECVEVSAFCPTDHDLLEVARALVPAVWIRERRTKCPYGACDGTGWAEEFRLYTIHPGDEHKTAWVEKRKLESREVFEELERKVDWKTQKVYSVRRRCICHPAREPEPVPQGRKRQVLIEKPSGIALI